MSVDPRPVLERVGEAGLPLLYQMLLEPGAGVADVRSTASRDAIGSAPADHRAVRRPQGEALRALAAGGQA